MWKVIIQSCSKPPTRDGLTFTSHIDHNLCFHIPQFLLSLAQSYHEVMTMDRRILKGFAMENPIRGGITIPKRTWENGQLMFRSWPWHIYCYLTCSSSSFFYICLMSSYNLGEISPAKLRNSLGTNPTDATGHFKTLLQCSQQRRSLRRLCWCLGPSDGSTTTGAPQARGMYPSKTRIDIEFMKGKFASE